MAKVWKKLQRSDADYTGNVTGTVDGETASNIKTKAIAGAAAKVITDDAFDGSNKLKVANAADGLKNSEVDAAHVGLGNVTNESKATMFTSPAITGTPTGLTATHVGLSNVTNHAQIKTDGSNAPSSLTNSSISISAAGALSGAGGGTVTASGVGAIQTDLGNAPSTIVNSNTTATDVGLENVANVRQNTTFYQDAIPTALAVGDIWVDTNDSNKQYRADAVGANEITSGEWEAMTPAKGAVGLGNVANESRATILSGNLTGTVDGTAVATVKSGAASGATANQDSTSTILGGNLTGTIDGTAVATVKSGAALGTSSNQDSTSTIRAGTTKANVGLSSVIDQAITVAGGKLKLDNVAQTMDADTIDGDTKATVKAAAVSTAETNIIGAAPGALNTLNELAAALGDDASFSSTMTTNLATKGKAPMTLVAEDVDGDSTYTNDPASEVVGQIGVYGGNQYVVVDI